jgi:hypothetical protein
MKVTSENQNYGHCMEIRNIKDNISDSSNQSNRDNGEDSNANVEHTLLLL